MMQLGQISTIRNKLEEWKMTEEEFSVQLPGTHPSSANTGTSFIGRLTGTVGPMPDFGNIDSDELLTTL
jgi:hypothetical protein